MEAKDLMIGDWVQFPSSYEKVREISYVDGIGMCASFAASATLFPVNIERIKPIPLTPEILDKNGFKEVDMNDFRLFRDKEYDCAGIRISFMSKGICLWKGDSIGISCKISGCCHYGIPAYVHLLQHAMRLCRIEKEIVL